MVEKLTGALEHFAHVIAEIPERDLGGRVRRRRGAGAAQLLEDDVREQRVLDDVNADDRMEECLERLDARLHESARHLLAGQFQDVRRVFVDVVLNEVREGFFGRHHSDTARRDRVINSLIQLFLHFRFH